MGRWSAVSLPVRPPGLLEGRCVEHPRTGVSAPNPLTRLDVHQSPPAAGDGLGALVHVVDHQLVLGTPQVEHRPGLELLLRRPRSAGTSDRPRQGQRKEGE